MELGAFPQAEVMTDVCSCVVFLRRCLPLCRHPPPPTPYYCDLIEAYLA